MRSSVCLIVPGRLDDRTGGYEYDRRLVQGLRQRGWTVDVREVAGQFPDPGDAALERADRMLASVPDGSLVLVDGLAFGAMPLQVEFHAARLRLVPIVHMPLGEEAGLDGQDASRLKSNEQRALASARMVIVTGARTALALTREGLGEDRILVVEPGTDVAPFARGSQEPVVHLVCVATLNAGKGHQVLFDALARIKALNWRLTCAGSHDRDPGTAQRLQASLRAAGLDRRVALVGELDATALADLYDRTDVFVLATLSETYGMAVAEAIARGLPVVSTTTGAIPSIVGDAAGLLVPPGDVSALAAALSSVVDDPSLRSRLAAGAKRARERLPSWQAAVEKIEKVLTRIQ